MQPVAQILIQLMPNGQIATKANGPNPAMLLGALEMAKANILAEMAKQAAGPQIATPPPGFDPGRVVPVG